MYRSRDVAHDCNRFIPRRTGSNVDLLNYILMKDGATNTESDLFIDDYKRFTNKAYVRWQRKMLQERVWSYTIMPKKILSFTQPQIVCEKRSIDCQIWPVRTRCKPLIGPPITVLDMPHFEGDTYHHGTDWGISGYLASICAGDVYVWHPEANAPNKVTNTMGTMGKCLRWNNDATVFAVALDVRGIAIFDFLEKKIVGETFCVCTSICSITSMEYTKTHLLISGCSLGRVCVWSRQLKHLNDRYSAHDGIIVKLSLSCMENYLATSGEDGNVRIWSWPSLNEHFQVSYRTPARGIAWHPWKDSLLAIGGGVGDGSMTIWNAANIKPLGYKPPSDNNAISIDSLTWNPLTGELVVSYWHQYKSTTNGLVQRSSIVVLSNLTTEVDAIEWHTGRVVYLLWGEKGSILASAGTDENLCIWKFLGNSPQTLKQFQKAPQKKYNFLENSLQTVKQKARQEGTNSRSSFLETAKRFGPTIR